MTEVMLWVVGIVLLLLVVLSWLPFPIKEWLGKTVVKVRSLFSGLFTPNEDALPDKISVFKTDGELPPDVAVCLSLLRETSDLAERLKAAGMVTAHKAMGTVAKRMAEVTATKLAEVIVGFESED